MLSQFPKFFVSRVLIPDFPIPFILFSDSKFSAKKLPCIENWIRVSVFVLHDFKFSSHGSKLKTYTVVVLWARKQVKSNKLQLLIAILTLARNNELRIYLMTYIVPKIVVQWTNAKNHKNYCLRGQHDRCFLLICSRYSKKPITRFSSRGGIHSLLQPKSKFLKQKGVLTNNPERLNESNET